MPIDSEPLPPEVAGLIADAAITAWDDIKILGLISREECIAALSPILRDLLRPALATAEENKLEWYAAVKSMREEAERADKAEAALATVTGERNEANRLWREAAKIADIQADVAVVAQDRVRVLEEALRKIEALQPEPFDKWARENWDKDEVSRLGYRMKVIASAALSPVSPASSEGAAAGKETA